MSGVITIISLSAAHFPPCGVSERVVMPFFWCIFVKLCSCFPPPLSYSLGIVIDASVLVNSTTGLSTTFSTLRYSTGKGDADAIFTCGMVDLAGQSTVSAPVTFTITCKAAAAAAAAPWSQLDPLSQPNTHKSVARRSYLSTVKKALAHFSGSRRSRTSWYCMNGS